MRRASLLVLVLVLMVPFVAAAAAAPPDDEPVTIAVQFGGPELDAFVAELAAWGQTDVEVSYYDGADAPGVITGDDPPDFQASTVDRLRRVLA